MATSEKIPVPQSAADITPYWVQLVLQKDLPDVIITDVDVKGSISQGEGYMSDIIAFDAVGTRNGKRECYSLVAKLTNFDLPTTTTGVPKHLQIRAETTEVRFYSIALPELLSVSVQSEQKFKSEGKHDEDSPPSGSLFLPKCYFAATDPSCMVSVRVMENLKSQGFSIKAGLQPLSRDEMMLTVGALAQVHGLSHRLELHSGKPLSEMYDWIFNVSSMAPNETKILRTGYRKGVKVFAAAFPDQTDIVAWLEKINGAAVLYEYARKDARTRLKVLNHADCWVNNIMIKYEGEVPVAVKLVDWQGLEFLPPTCQLASLFLRCSDWDVFHNHRDVILAHYHQELQKTLGPNESSLKNYTLEQLKADFQTDCLYGLCFCVVHLAFLVQPPHEDLPKMVQQINDWGVISRTRLTKLSGKL